ncbi:L-lactate permease [Rhodococcus sp. IEGM 1408]|uniref:L-lactate permease n=1 Tax=Rhodococcus sp. IEGM 1408 TaxID=3082220 RepID=UPI0029531486|nr:L-lactate permease [Rhodococcus sp. IEGM 1408]MDV8002740.1 L-lactate permease [Rhodococcus sp. IEGM 1408]
MSQLSQTGVAAAPIVVVLLLLALRVRSLRAGLAGLATAVLAAAAVFRPTSDEVAAAVASLGPTVLEVALILFGGVTLAVVMAGTGAREHIAGWLERTATASDRLPAILLLVFGLTPFMESVTGFGLGVVITAPLLIRMGLTPVKAVVAGLLGLVLVPWGSLGPGTLVAAQLGGQDFADLGYWSALLSLPVLVVSMVTVLVVVRPRATITPRPTTPLVTTTPPRTAIPARPTATLLTTCAAIVVVQWSALVGANALLGTAPAGVIASAAVILLLLGISRVRHGPLPPISRELVGALAPFGVLLLGILAVTVGLRLSGTPPGLAWLDSPAVWVNVAALVALRTTATPRPAAARMLGQALATWVPVAGNAVAFMMIGIVMATAGMAAHLAQSAAGIGGGFLALIPLVGALGGYLTGSNTGAAAMFSTATTAAAAGLGADTLVALAGQNVAGSFAIIVSPPRIALAVGVVMAAGEHLPAQATRTLATAVTAVSVILGGAVWVLA